MPRRFLIYVFDFHKGSQYSYEGREGTLQIPFPISHCDSQSQNSKSHFPGKRKIGKSYFPFFPFITRKVNKLEFRVLKYAAFIQECIIISITKLIHTEWIRRLSNLRNNKVKLLGLWPACFYCTCSCFHGALIIACTNWATCSSFSGLDYFYYKN